MISVVIPTLNAASTLARPLASLLTANACGLISEVIVSDGGSTDATADMADAAGARIVHGTKGRGGQLQRGAAGARGQWLLFLHADTALSEGWEEAASQAIADARNRTVFIFRLRFDQRGLRPRLVALGANIRATVFKLPYGDQGLLISRAHYDALGGFADLPLFEDVDLVRRIVKAGGRKALTMLKADATTSATRYVEDGYLSRVLRNARCVRMYFSGAPIEKILEVYHGRASRNKAAPRHHGQTATGRARQDEAQP